MAEQSTITSSDLAPVTAGATACDHLVELANTRSKFATFLDWIVDDADGDLASDFKTAVIRQLLFDAAKKGYLVMSDESTGYLTLTEKLLLTKLATSGYASGDYLIFNGTNWAKQTPVYLAPTSGGTTIPAASSGGILTVAHGLSAAPKNFRCVLECATTDVNYAVGDRVDALALMGVNGAGSELGQVVAPFANATLVGAVFRSPDGASDYRLPDKNSPYEKAVITPGSWNVKFYAMP